MTNLLNYVWIVLLAIYIISPIDANPLFFDDLIAAGALFYFLYKNSKAVKHRQQDSTYYRQSQTGQQSQQTGSTGPQGPLTLDEACRLLSVRPDSSLDEINKAYREKMAKSHPDKVSHLSEELQDKAEEITLKLNEAYNLVKRYKKE